MAQGYYALLYLSSEIGWSRALSFLNMLIPLQKKGDFFWLMTEQELFDIIPPDVDPYASIPVIRQDVLETQTQLAQNGTKAVYSQGGQSIQPIVLGPEVVFFAVNSSEPNLATQVPSLNSGTIIEDKEDKPEITPEAYCNYAISHPDVFEKVMDLVCNTRLKLAGYVGHMSDEIKIGNELRRKYSQLPQLAAFNGTATSEQKKAQEELTQGFYNLVKRSAVIYAGLSTLEAENA